MSSIAEDDGGSVEVKPEADFTQALGPHGAQKAGFIRSVKEKETAAAGADEFAPDRRRK